MTIPFFDLKRQYKELADDVERAVLEVMRSTKYVEGDAVKELERELSEYLNVKHVVTCNSGTDALRIALQAVGVDRGDEIITTPFTFYATAEAIAQIGATPVFVDIQDKSLNIDPTMMPSRINERTKAILPVHIFGMPADMDEINDIAEKNGISVIEDACQAIGAEYKGKKAGTLGDMGCFSFYPTKNLGGFGDGGMITTDDDELATYAKALKSHGAGHTAALAMKYRTGDCVRELENISQSDDGLYDPCKYYNFIVGGNSRLDSMQAAVLNVKLGTLGKKNKRRADIAGMYKEGLEGLPVVIPQKVDSEHISCWHQFAILVDEKDMFAEYLKSKGIGTGAFYPVPLHLQKVFLNLGYQKGNLPVAESVCDRSVCLPIFPELSDDEVKYIIGTIRDYFR